MISRALTFLIFSIAWWPSAYTIAAEKNDKVIKESITLVFNQRQQFEVLVILNSNGEELKGIYMRQLPLIKLFSAPLLEQLKQKPDPVTPADLQDLGVQVNFDSANLMLHMSVSKKNEYANKISLNPVIERDGNKGAINPAQASFMLSARPLYHYGEEDKLDGIGDVALRTGKLVWLADFLWQEGELDRRDVRMVYDLPQFSLRNSIGDVRSTANDVIVPVDVGGVSVATDFSMIPNGRPLPSPASELILERRARVDIYSRETLIQSMMLAAGKYRFQDFQFVNGISNVRFDVQEEGGRRYRVSVPYAIDERQLAQGKHEVSYTSGYRFSDDSGKRKYLKDDPLVTTMLHRYGWNHRTTLGAFTQFDSQHQVAGMESLMVHTWGSLKMDISASQLDEERGLRPSLSYLLRYFSDVQLTADYAHETPQFVRWGQVPTASKNLHVAALGIVMKPGSSWSVGLKNSRSWLLDESQRQRFEINLNGRTRSGLNVTSSLVRNELPTGLWESSGAVYVVYFFDDQKHSVDASYNSSQTFRSGQDDQYSVNARGNYRQGALQILPQLSVDDAYNSQQLERQQNMRFHLDTRHPRFDFTFDQQYSTQRSAGQVGFGAAIAYVDGTWGVGRPSPGAYAIVAGNQLHVSGGGLASATVVDSVPLLLTGLRPYDYAEVQLESEPDEYTLISENKTLNTAYFSGHLLKLKQKKWRVVALTLYDQQQKIVALKMGTARHLESGQIIEFFSNKKGLVIIEGLAPGNWQLGWEKSSVVLQIPDKSGRIEMGKIYAQ